MNITKECKHGTMIFNDKDTYVGKSLLEYGEYSEHEIEFLKPFIKPSDVVLDIGANIGALAVPFAKMVPNGKVIAIEPQQWIYYMLCGNMAVNNLENTYCLNFAIGKEIKEIDIPIVNYSVENNYGCLSLKQENWEENVNKDKVTMLSIDSLSLSMCHLIKIDVEGMEVDVLQGAFNTIKTHKPFLYIENDRPDEEEEIRKILAEHDYLIHDHIPPLYNENNYFKNEVNVFETCHSKNIFCYHKSKEITF